MADFESYDEDLRGFVEELVAFETTDGNEADAQAFVAGVLSGLGFDVYEFEADADVLAAHPSFPDDARDIDVAGRPVVGGVLEFGDPEAGRTLLLNGHVDVVPAEPERWETPPFEPSWDGDRLVGRGAADMKSGLGVCVFAARALADDPGDLDGRIVVESVVGEEAGGIGAAASALGDPYPFERDAAIITEPTELAPVVATEGSLMKRLELAGRSAHAATPWRGESVLPHFERIREAFADLERDRHDRITHPLYEDYPTRWPVVFGRVDAGNWASSVPDTLTAEVRIGVAPGETVAEVEAEFADALADVVADSEWLSAQAPQFERFGVQFEPSELDIDEPIVESVRAALAVADRDSTPVGVTYGADARHYIDAGIPTVLFGPGSIEQAHFPDESIAWPEVLDAGDVLVTAARNYLK